ncbi:DsbA family protein [Pseudohalioglobus sediminis]|uniref:DsbA family protein n=1 Tax=Pseudohalioglobus sediminis TaxID=2606449 RepID=A0A5B0X3I0_9GAMM|nr:DsbA family protein [Pseudohalioglobus sediminis]KAA1193097.1 DsbA family protein [Pseudohalioglobus sediminis]
MPASAATLYYVHDPMCSWCWGYRRTWDTLCAFLPADVSVVSVVGGLAPDTDEPMPIAQQETIAGYWRDVQAKTGAEFNFDFWRLCQPRRSTYPACRAVLAARLQGAEQAMIDAVQKAYYLRAMNPSDSSTLIKLARETGPNKQQFAQDLDSPAIQSELENEFALRKRLGVYSFPSLVLAHAGTHSSVPIDYLDYRPTLAAIAARLPV